MFSMRSPTVNEINDAGINDRAIEKMNAEIMPSDVLSNPCTDFGNGNGLKVISMLLLESPVAIFKIAVFI